VNIILEKLNQDEQVSVARFNDGEVGALVGDLRRTFKGEQSVDNTLISGLKRALDYRSKSYYIGYPCPECYPTYHNYVKQKIGNYERQILATFATNHNYKNFLEELEGVIWGEWVLVSDKDVNFGGPHKYVSCPSENAMSQAEKIIEDVLRFEEKIVILTCGAASRYIASELDQMGRSALDFGSIFDPHKGKLRKNGKAINTHVWEGFTNKAAFCGICNHAGI